MGEGGENDGAPADPITAMVAAAVQMHEAYRAYCEAGFTEAQSLYLTGVILSAALRREPGGGA